MWTNKSKDLFVARLGVALLLAQFGITGCAADWLGWPIRAVIGVMIDKGIYAVDVTLDTLKEGTTMEEFRKLAIPAYAKARKRVYTDAEKKQIRKEFLDISRKFVRIGGVSDVANP